MKKILISIALALVSFVLVTWLALEWSQVAIIKTKSSSGEIRETHIWFVHDGKDLWLEAGTPLNPWFVEVESIPEVSLEADGHSGDYLAEVVPGWDAARRVRGLLAEKYGIRDHWVGLFVDSTGSVAVRLSPR